MSYLTNTTFIKAIQFIYQNIDRPITLDEIAKAIGISVATLKRLFSQAVNESPGVFIRRLKMELAFRTLQSKNNSILEVALSSGFEDQSAFTRSFKETFGYLPKHARKKLNIVSEFDNITLDEPDIIELNDLPIQGITEQGLYYESAPKAFQNLKKLLSEEELSDDFSGFFIGIGHDNPHDGNIKENEVRFTAGVAMLERNLNIQKYLITGGLFARFHYYGKPNNMGLAYHYIYGKWSETASTKIDNSHPAFLSFEQFPNPMTEQRIIIHIPLNI
jgi:AraC-like DNA-binding protein/DNA gyrase inhibitor GyrI